MSLLRSLSLCPWLKAVSHNTLMPPILSYFLFAWFLSSFFYQTVFISLYFHVPWRLLGSYVQYVLVNLKMSWLKVKSQWSVCLFRFILNYCLAPSGITAMIFFFLWATCRVIRRCLERSDGEGVTVKESFKTRDNEPVWRKGQNADAKL